jgi:hypothetical protein
MANKYGVRIYPISEDVILIKQTIKRPNNPRYVVDTLKDGRHLEAHVNLEDDREIAVAVRLGLKGRLGPML